MSNNEITISSDALGNLNVSNVREAYSRLEWTADGLRIYLRGRFSTKLYASAANLAINECQARHISSFSLRRVVKGADYE